jgi:uncharacterized protein (DUF2249 family)
MSQVTQAFREHHRELAREMSRYVSSLAQGEPNADARGFSAFLKNELLAHAAGEEAQLYPVMDDLVRAHGKPTATMRVDHEYIQNYIAEIQMTAAALAAAAPDAQNALRAKLAQSALKLQAIFEMHLAKEERVYLPLFEKYLSEEAQQRVLDAMHEHAAAPSKAELDVRPIPPFHRHVLIFQTFEALAPGEGFELVNDHDPKPVYYQFAAERAGEFTWDYIAQGPHEWRVRIGKPANAH